MSSFRSCASDVSLRAAARYRASSLAMASRLKKSLRAAERQRAEKFTALFHHISVDLLREAFFVLKHDAPPGIDGLTWQTYATDLEQNLIDLHARVHRGAYRATAMR